MTYTTEYGFRQKLTFIDMQLRISTNAEGIMAALAKQFQIQF